jgi:hypothetical protein
MKYSENAGFGGLWVLGFARLSSFSANDRSVTVGQHLQIVFFNFFENCTYAVRVILILTN